MITAWVDPVGGMSGDMFLGALVDLIPDPARLPHALRDLPLDGFDVRVTEESRRGFRGRRVVVDVAGEQPERHLSDVLALVEASPVPPRVRERATRTFTRLADAEASVHGSTREAVHFHEVGAVDAIIDVVGTWLLAEWLDVDRFALTTPVPLGSGRTTSAHGVIPVPAPATVTLLTGVDVRFTKRNGECTTPTGAALLCTLLDGAPSDGTSSDGASSDTARLGAGGVGFGRRRAPDSDPPNMLRVFLSEVTPSVGTDEIDVLETVVDDASPEWLGYVMEVALEAGAKDVWFESVHMKKNRPGTKITVLGSPGDGERLAAVLFRETSSIGVRLRRERRLVLDRRRERRATVHGEVVFKVVRPPGGGERAVPEFDSCRRIAAVTGWALGDVYRWADRLWHRDRRDDADA